MTGYGAGLAENERRSARFAAGSAGMAQPAADAVSERLRVDCVLFVHGRLADLGDTPVR